MNSKVHPIVIYKKVDIIYTKDEEKHHEVKIKKYLPNIDLKILMQILKVILYISFIFVILTNKSKEAAPIISSILKQLQ